MLVLNLRVYLTRSGSLLYLKGLLSPDLYYKNNTSGVEQELHTLPEHLSSSQVFSGVHVAQSLVFFVVFCRSLFVLFLSFLWPNTDRRQQVEDYVIVLAILRLTASDFPFGIFKLFLPATILLCYKYNCCSHIKPGPGWLNELSSWIT